MQMRIFCVVGDRIPCPSLSRRRLSPAGHGWCRALWTLPDNSPLLGRRADSLAALDLLARRRGGRREETFALLVSAATRVPLLAALTTVLLRRQNETR
jgi:hypothetical protein